MYELVFCEFNFVHQAKMDGLFFTDPECPKVTFLLRALGARAGWTAFTAKWPPDLVATNMIASQRMTAGAAVSMSRTFQK
jgi:hypothetical protein